MEVADITVAVVSLSKGSGETGLNRRPLHRVRRIKANDTLCFVRVESRDPNLAGNLGGTYATRARLLSEPQPISWSAPCILGLGICNLIFELVTKFFRCLSIAGRHFANGSCY